MCMEDIRIGRKSKTFQSSVVVPTANSVVLIPANPNRISFWIAQPNADRINISMDTDAVTSSGIRITTTGNPFGLSLILDGDLVTRKFNAIATTSDKTIIVWETVLMEE